MATIKNEVLIRVYVVLGVILIVAGLIFAQAVKISVFEGETWKGAAKDRYIQTRKIKANRGNILAEDGSLLATSLPFFDVAFDPNSSGMRESDFKLYVDSLAHCVATYVDPSYTPGGYRDYLVDARNNGKQFVPIKKNVSFSEMQQIKRFPLFELGQYQGGLIATPKYRRERPFGMLANRTIGYVRENSKPIGLEGYFDRELAGEDGEQPMIRVEEDIWIPMNDLAKIEPRRGHDIVTTLDVDIQDLTEAALFRAMNVHDAAYGVAIVMEVETGAIRGIANLGRTKDGDLWETYNHAIGSATEPGSTFKLATILALLEGGHVDLTDSIDLELGKAQFYEEEMVDATYHQLEMTTVQRAFEISSNVGMAKLVQEHFGETEDADEFIDFLKQFNLHHKTGVEIEGEASPYIKEAYSKEDNWSGITLPWMAHGYELRLTPLQLLAFYNAVANDGKQMKPYLVSEIQDFGLTVDRFPPTVLKRSIASSSSIQKAKILLEGVVENGTAAKLKTNRYRFAGKTGTAQLNYRRVGSRNRVGGYQASFVGYFPAEAPRYSCIVVINNPRRGGFYGGEVALPVFREIADKIFATKIELLDPVNDVPPAPLATRSLPNKNVGDREQIMQLLAVLDLPYKNLSDYPVAVLDAQTDTLNLLKRKIPRDKVPNVVGMGLRDALYILENMGLKVEVIGNGKVVRQSIIPGTNTRGQTITLRLG
ncbi:MAG: penicillin-binding protein [Bacteroidota bacterium]